MLILTFYLLMPLMGFMAWTMNLSAHWMRSTANQLKVDALALSLCHSQKIFYETNIGLTNLRIRSIQVQMAAYAASCVADPFVCPAVAAKLRRLSIAGQNLMQIQDRSREAQIHLQRSRLQSLMVANQLGAAFGILDSSIIKNDGLIRETLIHPSSDGYQGLSPPLVLVPSEDFERLNEVHLKFRSKLAFLRSSKSLIDYKVKEELISKAIESRCAVPWSGPVERKTDGGQIDFAF